MALMQLLPLPLKSNRGPLEKKKMMATTNKNVAFVGKHQVPPRIHCSYVRAVKWRCIRVVYILHRLRVSHCPLHFAIVIMI